jgi:two-component system OmpR family response regulator
MRVLVVDDNVELVEMVSIILGLYGHETITAHSGEQAVDLVETEQPDVMLLDLMMPDMDGYETLSRVRGSAHGRDMRVIMTTASADLDLEHKVLSAGGDGCIRKPLTPDQIMDALQPRQASTARDPQPLAN